MACVYLVTNKVNGKKYVGYTKNFRERKNRHKDTAIKRNSPYAFHVAIRKYGWENFQWEIVYESWDSEHCLQMEQHFIEEYDSFGPNGYNMCEGGRRGTLGLKRKPLTEEQRNNIKRGLSGKNKRGKEHWAYGNPQAASENFKKAAALSKLGKHHSKETRKKISDSNMGYQNMLGKKHSATTLNKMAKAVPTWLRTLRAQTWRAISSNRASTLN